MKFRFWVGLLGPVACYAGAIYTTSVSSTFAIGSGGVAAGPTITFSMSTGAGMAGFGGMVSPGGVLPATISSGVTGTSPFAVSTATSTYQAGHLITLDNSASATPIMVPFMFSYSWMVTLGAMDPMLDFASAGAFFHITGIDNETLTIGGVPMGEYLVSHRYTTLGGGTGGSGMATVMGAIFVPAATFSVFSVITDTDGVASSVPEPSTAVLFAIAGAATVVRFRRRGGR